MNSHHRLTLLLCLLSCSGKGPEEETPDEPLLYMAVACADDACSSVIFDASMNEGIDADTTSWTFDDGDAQTGLMVSHSIDLDNPTWGVVLDTVRGSLGAAGGLWTNSGGSESSKAETIINVTIVKGCEFAAQLGAVEIGGCLSNNFQVKMIPVQVMGKLTTKEAKSFKFQITDNNTSSIAAPKVLNQGFTSAAKWRIDTTSGYSGQSGNYLEPLSIDSNSLWIDFTISPTASGTHKQVDYHLQHWAVNTGSYMTSSQALSATCDRRDGNNVGTIKVYTSSAVLDQDGDGYDAAEFGGDDCDDTDPTVYPGAEDIPDDGIDQDCDGEDATSTLCDADGDGYEDPSCGGDDCNDDDASMNPGATEICDGIDNDCDDDIDDEDSDVEGATTWYEDADGDGYGNASSRIVRCSQPPGMVADSTDCDDTSAEVHPGAEELPGNGIDDDCDGTID